MFHVEHCGLSPLLNMALSFTDYTAGAPITPNVNYKFSSPKPGDFAYLFTSSVVGATLQLTSTLPTDEEWSNVNSWEVNGPVVGRIFPLRAAIFYFRVVGPPSLAYDSTLAIKDLDLEWPSDITPTAIPTNGTPITPGFYSLDALSLAVGKFHSFSIVPAKSGNLVGKHETSDQHRFVATIFGVNAQGYPVSHMASFANMEQAIFNMDTAKAVLHLSAPEGAEFNYTCSIASFSSGSEGSLTPSSDANITGAWSFTNITVPTPTQAGSAANKGYVDTQISNCVKLTGDQTIDGVKTFETSPHVPRPSLTMQAVNKLYVDDQIVTTVKTSGAQNVGGVKTFTDGMTLADEKPLNLGAGANAVKIHGSGTGASVIEGGNGAALDIAVPVEFSEPVTFSKLKSDVSGTAGRLIRVYEAKASNATFEFVQYDTTGTFIFRPLNLSGAGLGVNPQGIVTLHGQVLAEKAVNFTAGVTMGQTLTVAGQLHSSGGLFMGDGVAIQFGTAVSIYATGADVWFEGPADGKTVYNQPIQFSSPPSGESLVATSGLNKEMGDSLYAPKVSAFSNTSNQTIYGNWEFNNAPTISDATDETPLKMLAVKELTQGAYDALTQKENNILYIITETGKVHLGPFLLN